ncbi:MAG: hypothetical protein JO202_17920, partial [Ktedonobacteraceae bacterium]|nr:hypothetical protein [Ktedonobacteraceae bacterium]
MAQQSATIKVACRADTLQDTANMLFWVIGHPVKIADVASDAETGCLFISTAIEYYENDVTILEHLGFDIIGKIQGVVSWEVLTTATEKEKTSTEFVTTKLRNGEESERLEADLMSILCALPVPISIMRRMNGKYAWKCLEADGHTDTFMAAVEEALT